MSPTGQFVEMSSSLDERNLSDVGNQIPSKAHPQTKSIFVHSLSESVTTQSLTELFSQSHPLKHAIVVQDPKTKQSKGYGFVTFADSEDAQKALDSLNGFLFEGRKIKIEVAEPRHRSGKIGENTAEDKIHSAGTGTERLRPKPEAQKPLKLIIRNLPWTIKEPEQLAALFRSYGKVKHATLPKKRPGLSPGFGFVVLRGRKNAEKALEDMNGKEIEGRVLAVDWAVEKELWEASRRGLENEHSTKGLSSRFSDGCAENDGSRSEKATDDDSSPNVDDEVDSNPGKEAETQRENDSASSNDSSDQESRSKSNNSTMSTCFIRNLPFSATDETIREHFSSFGPVRFARVVMDAATERSRGTGFVCFYRQEDANACLRERPRTRSALGKATTPNGGSSFPQRKQSLLEDFATDALGRYTLDGRVLQISQAVDKVEAQRLLTAGTSLRAARDKDRRRLYLFSEGTISSNSPLYEQLASSEIKLREDSMKQRQRLLKSNPSLHLSLTRLSVRNLPHSMTSKTLKALAREAVVGFAREVKAGLRKPLSKEELARGGTELRDAEKARKAKGKGIVRQTKIVFEGREGKKISEDSGAGRSRGYGFIEYSSHRWALMGLRWLNGYAARNTWSNSKNTLGARDGMNKSKERLIVEFAIENAQVVSRRQEREAKARERSKLISREKERGENPASTAKKLSRDTLMAMTRKGVKRKRESYEIPNIEHTPASSLEEGSNVDRSRGSTEQAKRQRIIGKKRMIRRVRKGKNAP